MSFSYIFITKPIIVARGMVSPNWPTLGHVLTLVAGSRERVTELNELDLTTINGFSLRKKILLPEEMGKESDG